jgi:hypothetical protein
LRSDHRVVSEAIRLWNQDGG